MKTFNKHNATDKSVVYQIWIGIATMTIMLAFAGFLLVKEVNFLRAATYQIMIAVIGCSIMYILKKGMKEYIYKMISPLYWIGGSLAILYMGVLYVYTTKKYTPILRYFSKAGKFIAWCFGAFIQIEEGLDKIDKNKQYIFMCNHLSFIDYFIATIITGLFSRKYTVVYGKNLEKWPIFGWTLRRWFIPVDRKSKEDKVLCLRKIKSALSEGKNVLLFPEGGRMTKEDIEAGKLLNEMLLPTFSAAVDQKIEILPVVIHAQNFCYKDHFTIRPQTIKISFLDPLAMSGSEKKEDIRDLVSSLMKRELLRERLLRERLRK